MNALEFFDLLFDFLVSFLIHKFLFVFKAGVVVFGFIFFLSIATKFFLNLFDLLF